ncbi:MAG: hypothetical protein COX57_02260 [Alphaproteobacteria bacterium CG_4_10_14_0_2_um_filter_63_37]|nr:MAG: hypothetical protein AUJ55_08405 [Proteobacteria bacterium CG1_02_64_396]PJA25645.1 MAG: hypothetical protein COX57_02260 [Alphaproteobacteria bacterium CG_4_10_14_0_2_um_filter_63_37]
MKVILIGEHDKGLGTPFPASTVSGKRRRTIIADVGLNCALGNAFIFVMGGKTHPNDLTSMTAGFDVVVALGAVAENACIEQGISPTRLPHPAVRGQAQLAALRDGLGALAIRQRGGGQ